MQVQFQVPVAFLTMDNGKRDHQLSISEIQKTTFPRTETALYLHLYNAFNHWNFVHSFNYI